MAEAPSVPVDRDAVHFETFWSAALARVQAVCGDRWTDLAEHDPGVTLLQALAYGASDLAYRHTLPLVDLLTPKDGDGAIFPASFSAQVALSTAPITPDDFCRALLDIVDWPDGRFVLRDVQLVSLRDEAAPTFFYDPAGRTYSRKGEHDDCRPIRLAGGYDVYLMPERDRDLNAARRTVDEWLRKNRNICEFFVRILWLKPIDVDLHVEVEIYDDWADVDAAIAAVGRACDETLAARPIRTDSSWLSAAGISPDLAFDGPRAEHGWIVQLPPTRDYSVAYAADLDLLERAIRAVPCIRRVVSISWGGAEEDRIEIPAGHFPHLWPAGLADSIVVTKRGQHLQATSPELLGPDVLHVVAPEPEALRAFPRGRYRRLGDYASVSSLLPALYGLHETPTSSAAHQLYQFMLPFEHQLASGCDQLDRLARLLGFTEDRDVAAPIWGTRWPFDVDTLPEDVAYQQSLYRHVLDGISYTQSLDHEKSFELIDYLLGYFGIDPTDRTLSIDGSKVFNARVGLLKRAAELGRSRTTFPTDESSAIQLRLAARLGWGDALFDPQLALEDYPFYIVEHIALLPPVPDEQYDDWQSVYSHAIVNDAAGRRQLLIGLPKTVDGIVVSQMIDLRFGEHEIVALVVADVNQAAVRMAIDIDSHRHLKAVVNHLEGTKPADIQWRNADLWLRAIDYQPSYASQSADDPVRTLTIRPFPLGAQEGVEFEIESRESGGATQSALRGKICSVDPVQSTIMASVTGEAWPDSIEDYSLRLSPEATAVDNFSFAATVVFNRDDFAGVTDPHALVGWLSEVIQQEFPLNVEARVLWMTSDEFRSFRLAYSDWRRSGGVLGDRVYTLLEMLALGQRPVDTADGIRAMRIPAEDDADRKGVLGDNGLYEKLSAVRATGLIYVPKRVQSAQEEDRGDG
ncbi:MAG: hypothetical protein H0X39_05190 [Actinobacteria bacterium]|nr:hypothetical protein [Actinomycetota bacterium]